MTETKPLVKVTEFEGYMGGDGECFCLEKEKYEFLGHKFSEMDDDEIAECMKKERENRLYPSELFPEECHPLTQEHGKFKFKITIEAIAINENKSMEAKE